MRAGPHPDSIRPARPLPKEQRGEPWAEVTATDLCLAATALFARERRGIGEVIQAWPLPTTSGLLGRAPPLWEETARGRHGSAEAPQLRAMTRFLLQSRFHRLALQSLQHSAQEHTGLTARTVPYGPLLRFLPSRGLDSIATTLTHSSSARAAPWTPRTRICCGSAPLS